MNWTTVLMNYRTAALATAAAALCLAVAISAASTAGGFWVVAAPIPTGPKETLIKCSLSTASIDRVRSA
jgi:hypothetical protein